MKVNTVDFTASTRVPTVPLGKRAKISNVRPENPLKPADIIPVSGLLGASLLSVYFIKKGNLDIGMRMLHI